MKSSKLILPTILIVVIAVIYFNYFAPTQKLGSFDKFDGGSEINQQINVGVVRSKDFERDANGGIVSFYAHDKNNVEIKITLHEPAPEEIVNAEVVELMGHLHGNSFVTSKVSIIK
ncbi:MAG: hypothetical protein COZ80_04110 [Ignavibacteria bacterium CG_4_8_14_3_um_filter_37_9]|nr:hypothetical protein [Ignavibacteria bacterium]OIO22171.1 MAG: hypothetical protein AUJ54_03905 [Ignavibacteria bacterium CG1_02_37_35]PIW99681.1 MAG: hypothetical protein COZ80_04110 [Ignavibacteria bacterium CG_4_8_14_3_um_filter_37_9]PIX94611.1 MAG: hypothetical protein COZ25_04700 [Ignavibacteria bacterium CG_4_10_14_3_um_filter_37_18]